MGYSRFNGIQDGGCLSFYLLNVLIMFNHCYWWDGKSRKNSLEQALGRRVQ